MNPKMYDPGQVRIDAPFNLTKKSSAKNSTDLPLQRGASLVELAFAMPFLVAITFGVVSVGGRLKDYGVMSHVAYLTAQHGIDTGGIGPDAADTTKALYLASIGKQNDQSSPVLVANILADDGDIIKVALSTESKDLVSGGLSPISFSLTGPMRKAIEEDILPVGNPTDGTFRSCSGDVIHAENFNPCSCNLINGDCGNSFGHPPPPPPPDHNCQNKNDGDDGKGGGGTCDEIACAKNGGSCKDNQCVIEGVSCDPKVCGDSGGICDGDKCVVTKLSCDQKTCEDSGGKCENDVCVGGSGHNGGGGGTSGGSKISMGTNGRILGYYCET